MAGGNEEPARITGPRLARHATTFLADNGARIDSYTTPDGYRIHIVSQHGFVEGISLSFLEALRLARGLPGA